MKKRAILFLGVLAGFSLSAQQVALKAPQKEVGEATTQVSSVKAETINKTQAVLWSEDFSGGIPSTWSNVVTTDAGVLLPNGSWEYRGASTTPNNTTGSRGAYVGTRGPIQSPTASNGFVIFDSDYMDNNGVVGAFGSGVAPSPHIATLTTDTIDLTGSPFVEVKMHSYVRQFQSNFLVAVSNDGGQTFSDTVGFYSSLGANNDGPTGDIITANISATAGNQANVVLAFIFDGDYYFWQIDDIEVRDLPRNELRFTVASDGAPAHDAIYNGGGGAKKGTMSLSQIVPINYDANLYNFGSQTQTNVVLNVEIFNDAGSLVTTLSSPAVASLASGDTATYVNLVTPTWTPSAVGTYDIVYTFSSDSISGMMAARDTFQQVISSGDGLPGTASRDVNGIDWGVFSSSFGTHIADYGTDGGGQFVMVDLSNGNANGEVLMEGVQIGFSTLTVDGGDILVELYDTTGFTYPNGFASSALISEQFNLGVGTSGSVSNFLFTGGTVNTDTTGGGATAGYVVPEGQYALVVYTFSNNGANTIRIANDQSYSQPSFSKGMYFVADSRWYSGYSNSLAFNAPWIRSLSESSNFSVEEGVVNELTVFPNPTTGNVNLTLTEGGAYTIQLIDMVGNVVSSEEVVVNGNEKLSRDFSEVTSGIYLLNVSGENFSKTTKLTIQ